MPCLRRASLLWCILLDRYCQVCTGVGLCTHNSVSSSGLMAISEGTYASNSFPWSKCPYERYICREMAAYTVSTLADAA